MTDTSLYDLYSALAKAHADQNIYSSIAPSLISIGAQTRTDNPWANLATGIVSGLLGGGLGAYGRNQEKAYQGDLGSALSALKLGQSPNLTDNFDASDLKSAQGAFSIFDQSRKANLDSIFQDALLKGKGDAEGKTQGQLEAFNALKTDGKVDGKADSKPDALKQAVLDSTDIGKAAIDRQKMAADEEHKTQDYLTTKDPTGQAWAQMGPAYETLLRSIPGNSPETDTTFKAGMARILDPVGSIGQGAGELANAAVPLYEQMIGKLKLGAGGTLDPETKLNIVKALSARVAPVGEQFNQIYKTQIDALKDRGGSPEHVNLPQYTPFDEAGTRKQYGIIPPLEQLRLEGQDLKQQFIKSGLDPDTAAAQATAQLRLKYQRQ